METNCPKCGLLYEVRKAQKNSYMFCLRCDDFFKVKEKIKIHENAFNATVEEKSEFADQTTNKLKATLKNLFVPKSAASKPKPSEKEHKLAELAADPPKMNKENFTHEAKSFTLIDDFLDSEFDLENHPENLPTEYIDFLSVGLDVSSSDLLEKHDKNTSI